MNKITLLFAAVLAMSSCHYVNRRHLSGNGRVSTEQRNINGFTGVETHGSVDIIVSQGNYNVKVEADQNLLQYIETKIMNGHLAVDFRNGFSIGDYATAKVYITAPELNVFETHGSGNINGQGKISDKTKIDIGVWGSGDVELNLDCPMINTQTHGSGDITLEGETRNVVCEDRASGDIKASGLKAETVKISLHGSGDVETFASESLNVEISGSGDVHYKGQPRISTTVHGSGTCTSF